MIELLEINENSEELKKLNSWEQKVLLSKSKKGKITAFPYAENKFCFISNDIAIKDVFVFDKMTQEEVDKLKIALSEIFPGNNILLNFNTIKCNLPYFKDTTIELGDYLTTIRYDAISQFKPKFLEAIQKFETKNQGLKVVYNDELKEFENETIGFIKNHLGKNIYKITSYFNLSPQERVWEIHSIKTNINIAHCDVGLDVHDFLILTNKKFRNHGFATLLRAFSYYEHIRDGGIINYTVDKNNLASVKLMNFFSTENDLDCIELDIEKIRSHCYISRNKELPSNNLKIETPLNQEETRSLLLKNNKKSCCIIS